MREMLPTAEVQDAPVRPAEESDAPAIGALAGSASRLPLVVPIGAALALDACSGSGSPAPTPTPSPTATPSPSASITPMQASRFLAQASFGATSADIALVQSMGFDGWITDQIGRARTSHWDWLVANGYADISFRSTQAGIDSSIWRQIISEPGQLRQRVGMALAEMMVVGVAGLQVSWKAMAMGAYLDILLDNAFGNFRTLLDAITNNAAMASFLTFLGNRKANPTTGALPDENYARELMQLFTIGLYRLNMDGTLQLSGGQPIETYSQNDVSQLARVFTGLSLDSTDNSTPDRLRRPLVVNASIHETGASSFLGATVPAGTAGPAAVTIALDTIFAHPNVPPFVSKQLIQRLVTSNPSAAYVGRVAAVFANNGSGVRGDLRAVVRAILLDTEARSDAVLNSNSAGKLREPVIRLTNWARAFGAASASGQWRIGDTSSPTTRLAESFGRSASVFNFFRPGYSPPNTALSASSLVGPEFQITDEQSVVGYVNYLQSVIANGAGSGDVRADYADVLPLAGTSQSLVDQVNLLLAAGQLSSATVAAIRTAVDSIAATANNAAQSRVNIAVLLTMASPEYLALR